MKKKLLLILLLSAAIHQFSFASLSVDVNKKPTLIVGIVVDQMRYDYLTRYWSKYGPDGFKKLIAEGTYCVNNHFNYIPTYTGPGHASIYTGTIPAVHGIISNNWYDRNVGKTVYCTEDSAVTGIGGILAGKMSPSRLLSTTISDELRLASNLRSKVIGISLKDRGAILPAGFSGNGAYWYDGSTGDWITSSWYMQTLPQWVKDFNLQKRAASFLKKPWTTLLPIEQYTESTADNTEYEEPFKGETAPVFPHDFPLIGPQNYELVRRSPYGSTLTMEFALSALKGEMLGKDEHTDLLAVSFSSTDYIGHQFGTNAIETEDAYLRLDRDLAIMIREIELACGKENVLFFLTADHGAVPNPVYLQERKIPAGYFDSAVLKDTLEKHLTTVFGTGPYILTIDNDQIFLDKKMIASRKIEADALQNKIVDFLLTYPGIARALTSRQLSSECSSSGPESFMKKGFCPSRSGDVGYLMQPGLIEWTGKGTTHGSAYTYDTHVPLIFYGAGTKKGVIEKKTHITDIAPTLSLLLGIQPPSGCTGEVIEGVIDFK